MIVATAAIGGQLDLFADIDATQQLADHACAQRRFDEAPSLFSLHPLGFHAREAVYHRWVETHGSFDCIRRSHAWHGAGYQHHGATATETHAPATLAADLRCDHFDAECCCVGDLVYRGGCLGCGWEGEPREDENTAAEDAHDHAWPGWRQLPVVPRCPEANWPAATGFDDVHRVCRRARSGHKRAACGRFLPTQADTETLTLQEKADPAGIRRYRPARLARHS